jgi:hypothetical protein
VSAKSTGPRAGDPRVGGDLELRRRDAELGPARAQASANSRADAYAAAIAAHRRASTTWRDAGTSLRVDVDVGRSGDASAQLLLGVLPAVAALEGTVAGQQRIHRRAQAPHLAGHRPAVCSAITSGALHGIDMASTSSAVCRASEEEIPKSASTGARRS